MKIVALIIMLVVAVSPAFATDPTVLPGGCGTATYSAGTKPPTQDASGRACVTTPAAVATAVQDYSGTITLGGTAQTLMAASATGVGYEIQNLSSGDLWFNENGSTALLTQPSIWLPSGAIYSSPVGKPATAAVSIIGATTGQAFSARRWAQ